jgi:hypothetical protein
LKAQWYKGVPPAEAVAAHETGHSRVDGIQLAVIMVSDAENVHRSAPGDGQLFGNWVIHHIKSNIDPYVSISCLKVVEGRVYMRLGFTQWLLMSSCRWANPEHIKCYPVGDDGLTQGE